MKREIREIREKSLAVSFVLQHGKFGFFCFSREYNDVFVIFFFRRQWNALQIYMYCMKNEEYRFGTFVIASRSQKKKNRLITRH